MDVTISNSVIDCGEVQGSIMNVTEKMTGLGIDELVFDGVTFDRQVPEEDLEAILAGETGRVQLVMCRCKNHFVVKRPFRRMSRIEKVLCVMRR